MRRRWALLLILAVSLLGCTGTNVGAAQSSAPSQLANGAVVSGIQIGIPVCAPPADCTAVLTFAQTEATKAGLVDADSITNTSVYQQYVPEGMYSTGGGYVVVYDLRDGSQAAIRVHCGVGPCIVVPLQPLIDKIPSPSDYSNNPDGSLAPDDTGNPNGTAEPNGEASPSR